MRAHALETRMSNSLAGAVIAFDLDGTLVDTALDLTGTLNVLLAEEGIATLPADEIRPFIGKGARWLVERGFQAAGVELSQADGARLFERFIAHYGDHCADASQPFPGVEAALDALAAQGAVLAVCTNKRTDLSHKVLDAFDLTRRFAAVIGADLAPAAKPDPRHLQLAVEAAGGSLARAVLVGDAATDVGAARAAGAGLILVSFGYTETPARDLDHDILIDRFADLPAACVRLLGACDP